MTDIDHGPVTPTVSGPARLAALDLTVDVVATALAAADSESAHCTDLDPPILEGLLRWGRATRALREQLVPQGWTYDNPNNLARTIHPSGDFAVVLATGDEGTGLPSSGAGPRHARGLGLQRSVGNAAVAGHLGGPHHQCAAAPMAFVQRCGPTPCNCSADERADYAQKHPDEPATSTAGAAEAGHDRG